MLGIFTIEMSTAVWVLSCVFCIALILSSLSRVQATLCLLISVSFSFSQLYLDLGYIVAQPVIAGVDLFRSFGSRMYIINEASI